MMQLKHFSRGIDTHSNSFASLLKKMYTLKRCNQKIFNEELIQVLLVCVCLCVCVCGGGGGGGRGGGYCFKILFSLLF